VLVSEQNKRLVRDITDVIWNGRDLDRIAQFYAPDFVGDYRRTPFVKDTRASVPWSKEHGQRSLTTTRRFTS
jgi:hypothetical protein